MLEIPKQTPMLTHEHMFMRLLIRIFHTSQFNKLQCNRERGDVPQRVSPCSFTLMKNKTLCPDWRG